MLSGISVKDLEGETNGMYAVKVGEKILKSGERLEKEEWGVKGDRGRGRKLRRDFSMFSWFNSFVHILSLHWCSFS